MREKPNKFEECFERIRAITGGKSPWDEVEDPDAIIRWMRGHEDHGASQADIDKVMKWPATRAESHRQEETK